MLVLGMVPVTWAHRQRIPVATGVVATSTSLETHQGRATSQTEAGEVLQLPKDTLWKVGDTVACDRMDAATDPRLQDGTPWQERPVARLVP